MCAPTSVVVNRVSEQQQHVQPQPLVLWARLARDCAARTDRGAPSGSRFRRARCRAFDEVFWEHKMTRALERGTYYCRVCSSLPGLKRRFARRDRHFRAGARIAADAGFARFHGEDAEAAQFDAVALLQRALHLLEHGLHGHLGFGLGDAGLVDDFVDDVELDQNAPPAA